MSKRKSKSQPQPEGRKVASQPPQRGQGQRLWLFALASLLGVAALVLVIWNGGGPGLNPAAATAAPPATPMTPATPVAQTTVVPAWPVGNVVYCRKNPHFAAAERLGQSVGVSTTERGIKGLVLYDSTLPPDQIRLGNSGVYQHPSWDDAGYLGPVATTAEGNIFTAPSPHVSLVENPPERANILYIVDTNSAEMRPFLDLPAAAPPSPANPYGILGLAYDCDTGTVYVGSIAGSSYREEVGRIFQVDVVTGEILDMWENVDALGIAIFNGVSGKRLYYGAARTPAVRSIALDDAGRFAGDERTEIVLSELGNRFDLRARRMNFAASTHEMQLRAVEFYYNLVAVSEVRSENFRFSYDQSRDRWQVIQ
jgi:hypothetical protein